MVMEGFFGSSDLAIEAVYLALGALHLEDRVPYAEVLELLLDLPSDRVGLAYPPVIDEDVR